MATVFKESKKYYKLDMCLWNTDAAGDNKVKVWQKSLSPTFWPHPIPGACDVRKVWGTHRWTYSPSLVTVSSPKLLILHFVSGAELRTDGQTDGRTDRHTIRLLDAPATFPAGGIKIVFWHESQAKKKYRGMFETQKVRRHDKFGKGWSQH